MKTALSDQARLPRLPLEPVRPTGCDAADHHNRIRARNRRLGRIPPEAGPKPYSQACSTPQEQNRNIVAGRADNHPTYVL